MRLRIGHPTLIALTILVAHASSVRSETTHSFSVGPPSPKIGNGVFTGDYPAVALLATPTGICTATLIGCQTVLTAAHCVCPEGSSGATCGTPNPSGYRLFFQNSGPFSLSSIAVAPSWAPAGGLARHDLAILHLAFPVAGVKPMPLNTAGKPPIGTTVSLVGFGLTVAPSASVGLKRSGLGQLSACVGGNPGALCYDFTDPIGPAGQDSTGCAGDSGGPMLMAAASATVLAGVTSGAAGPGAADCTAPHQEFYTDTFTDRAWIQGQAGADLGQATCGGIPSAGSALAPYSGGFGVLDPTHNAVDFTLQVPPGTQALVTTINGENFFANNFDLYVKLGSQGSSGSFDCRGISPDALDGCVVSNPAPGTWHLTATRTSGSGAFQLTATMFKSASAPCVPNATTACLQNGRFEARVQYRNNSSSGSGGIMSFGGQRAESIESAFFYFTSATNFEMGLKLLNACVPAFGNKYWVFVSGLTDQGWVVTIRDTQTGAIKTYSNLLGHLSMTFADVAAFDC